MVIEASDGLSVTWVEDDQSVDAEVTVTITVTDVAEPPARPDAPLAEATATDPATSLDVNWSIGCRNRDAPHDRLRRSLPRHGGQ